MSRESFRSSYALHSVTAISGHGVVCGQNYEPDLASCIQDDMPFEPGEGVEEFLQLLEAGKPLPPDPRQLGRPKESAQSFLRRMDALQARFDAQFLKRKDWQVWATPMTCTSHDSYY